MATQILIVDPCEAVRQQVQDHLGKLGFAIISARETQRALDLLLTPNNSISLVLCELNAAPVDGIELLSQLHAAGRETPVVVMSSETSPKLITAAVRAGAQAWLAKPLVPRRLENVALKFAA